MKKNIAILGSTGSIGTQTLEVISQYPEKFEVTLLSANTNADLLITQARTHHPDVVIISDKTKYTAVNTALSSQGIKVYAGPDAIVQAMEMDTIDLVMAASVGYSGLRPAISAIRTGKDIALANKEILVIAGKQITELAQLHGVHIYPVDSEHSAIMQCLAGETNNAVEKIYLTASGGPFRGKDITYLRTVNKNDALQHPNWNMGNKITIDSATMMNKGLEMIEARWLFNLHPEKIDIIVHPQSIIHSVVQFEDGSMKAQMGLPDMKLPILYAMSYPERYKTNFPRFNFLDYPELTFEKPDMRNFKNLTLAYLAAEKDGNMPCIMNAANEIAVQAFLQEQIGFVDITNLIEKCMSKMTFIQQPTIDDYIITDKETRIMAMELLP